MSIQCFLQGSALLAASLALSGCGGASATPASTPVIVSSASNNIPNLQPYPTPTGTVSTFNRAGSIDPGGIFFQALGANARSCSTCHQLSQAMGLSAATAQFLFDSTAGADPLFLALDGANCPSVPTGDASGHSLILNSGLIRVARALPANAEFQAAASLDPYGCAMSSDPSTGQPILSVYRRPLPASSLSFLTQLMWDARATLAPLGSQPTRAAALQTDLGAQAADALATHLQGGILSSDQLTQLTAFETGLFSAEATDAQVGPLAAAGATGAATSLAFQNFYPGVNDALGGDPTGAPFNPNVFTLFQAWRGSLDPGQASIARGEDIFNTAPLQITAVAGLNDNPALGSPAVLRASCSTCHDAPNLGNHSLPLALDIGLSHDPATEPNPAVQAALARLTLPLLPIYQITGCPRPAATTDPGLALTTGLCSDLNKLKIPILRGLAARAPYFHNGAAPDLATLVNFYAARFQMNLTPQQRQDLVNFLSAL